MADLGFEYKLILEFLFLIILIKFFKGRSYIFNEKLFLDEK